MIDECTWRNVCGLSSAQIGRRQAGQQCSGGVRVDGLVYDFTACLAGSVNAYLAGFGLGYDIT
jgi:hypothetical protein